MVNRLLPIILLFCSMSMASSFFLEEEQPVPIKEEKKAKWSYGIGTGFSFIFRQFDLSLYGTLQYRINDLWALSGGIASDILESRYDFGARGLWYFYPEDFLMAGVSGVLLVQESGTVFPPRISFGYGKDFLPWENAHFFLRTVISISYVIGDYIESSPTELGITEINQVVLHGEFSILFF